jgi:hypothetical protein
MEQPDNRLRLPALAEYRRATAHRRAAAFCDLPDYVLGIPVLPVTPRTFSMLFAIESRFIFGGQPMEGDVRNFLWFHSPLYANCAVAGWQGRKRRALAPLCRQLGVERWRRWLGLGISADRYAAALVLAISDINKILDDAFADAPRGKSTKAPLASLEATLIHEFAAAYDWTPERTRNTPLRQLFQLNRCVAAYSGHDVRDDGEDAILADHLLKKNADKLAQAHV